MNKKQLRNEFINLRKVFNNKKYFDDLVFNNFINSELFKNSSTILTYISTDFEVDTIKIIKYCLKHNKNVYVPVINDDKTMDFHKILTLNDLIVNKYNILEPIPKENTKFINNNELINTICLTPAIVYDKKGYRIGYGGGFYDKFFERNMCTKVGLIYNDFVVDNLSNVTDEYDIPVNYIVTNNTVFNTSL